jgi:hypothetical protein
VFELFFNSQELGITAAGIIVCSLTSLVVGVLTALVHTFHQVSNRNFVITLALLPVIIQSIIMLVNGSVGTGIAVMGAFSLIRFRSVPGTAREIAGIFLAMALGLATGTGHIWYAIVFALGINGMLLLFSAIHFGEPKAPLKSLKIVVPEDMDYPVIFNDIFSEYTQKTSLERVRTVNLGSLYELQYTIVLKDQQKEKEFLDSIRQRNSNLEVSCSRAALNREEL